MKRKSLFYLFTLNLLLFFFSCSEDRIDKNFEELEISRSVEYDAKTKKILDGFKIAMKKATVIANKLYLSDVIIDPKYFSYKVCNTQLQVVLLEYNKNGAGGFFYVNIELIQEYTHLGCILIALHELFHMENGMSNDAGHEEMIKNPTYHKWIQNFLGCNMDEARVLSYLGTEDTLGMYKNMSEDEKKAFFRYQKEVIRKYKLRNE